MRPPERRRPPAWQPDGLHDHPDDDHRQLTEPVSQPPAVNPLRRTLDDAIAETGCTMKELTVLSAQVDPFRLDTPANHRDGKWLAEAARDTGVLVDDRLIHLRGLHYAIALSPEPFIKPDGTRYLNNDADWQWLLNAAKAARWLGYIDFDQIHDKKHAKPIVRIFERETPTPRLYVGIDVDIPDPDDIEPRVDLAGFVGEQPYKLVMIGEKASLDEGLTPIAAEYRADLYLLTGNISDALVHQIAKIGAQDGRPMVVLYFSDCDPAGWNMPIEVGRKLQAFKACLYPALEFRQYRALLTPDQVHEHGLPEAPLKVDPQTSEYADRRSKKWKEAMGVEQSEVDVLTVPNRLPLLRRLARQAIEPFFDSTLAARVAEARQAWVDDAQTIVDGSVDHELLEQLRSRAEEKLGELRAEIEAINAAASIDPDGFDLPPVPTVPEPVIVDEPMPLVDSRWLFTEQCRALKDSKAYNGDDS